MVLVITLGPWFGDLKYKFTTNAGDTTDEGAAKLKHMTYIFNTFVFLQIFNYFNCRKIGARDLNIFEGITGNFYFLAVVLGTFFGQILLVHWFKGITRTTSISKAEWGTCIVIGSSSLLIAFLLKLTPDKLLDKLKMDKLVDENKNMDDNKALQMFDKVANTKVGKDEVDQDKENPDSKL